MACANYAVGFGYRLFLVPVSACALDLSSISGGIADTGAFINLGTADANVVASTYNLVEGATSDDIQGGLTAPANIVFDNDVVSTETVFELFGLSAATLETDTGTETAATYDLLSEGFDENVPISQSWSMSLEGVIKNTDAGYKLLRLLNKNAVSGGLYAKIGRIGPTGTTEAIYGYVSVNGFSEANAAKTLVKWSATAQGYGPFNITLDNAGGTNADGTT
ncbi:predicted protein [Cyanophage PSS2]|nr:predicted protein [Cyanophage PSS2]